MALFRVSPYCRLPTNLANSKELHYVLLNLFLLKYGVLARPSDDLESLGQSSGVDPWFELMKRYQQYPEEDQLSLKGSNLLDWTLSSDVALYFANDRRSGEGAVYICDPAATGKTMQTIPVGEILDTMDRFGNAGQPKPCGTPLFFCPPKQIQNQRATNQQARYVAQMDLRFDLETQWRTVGSKNPSEIILVKLVLPADTEDEVRSYLMNKGICGSFIYSG